MCKLNISYKYRLLAFFFNIVYALDHFFPFRVGVKMSKVKQLLCTFFGRLFIFNSETPKRACHT